MASISFANHRHNSLWLWFFGHHPVLWSPPISAIMIGALCWSASVHSAPSPIPTHIHHQHKSESHFPPTPKGLRFHSALKNEYAFPVEKQCCFVIKMLIKIYTVQLKKMTIGTFEGYRSVCSMWSWYLGSKLPAQLLMRIDGNKPPCDVLPVVTFC